MTSSVTGQVQLQDKFSYRTSSVKIQFSKKGLFLYNVDLITRFNIWL